MGDPKWLCLATSLAEQQQSLFVRRAFRPLVHYFPEPCLYYTVHVQVPSALAALCNYFSDNAHYSMTMLTILQEEFTLGSVRSSVCPSALSHMNHPWRLKAISDEGTDEQRLPNKLSCSVHAVDEIFSEQLLEIICLEQLKNRFRKKKFQRYMYSVVGLQTVVSGLPLTYRGTLYPREVDLARGEMHLKCYAIFRQNGNYCIK